MLRPRQSILAIPIRAIPIRAVNRGAILGLAALLAAAPSQSRSGAPRAPAATPEARTAPPTAADGAPRRPRDPSGEKPKVETDPTQGPRPHPAPDAPLDPAQLARLGLRGGVRVPWTVAPTTSANAKEPSVDQRTLTLDGVARTLRRRSIRSSDCVLEIVSPDGARRLEPLPESALWTSEPRSDSAAVVVASIRDHALSVLGVDGSTAWSVEPLDLAGSTHVRAQLADTAPVPLHCGTGAAEVAVAPALEGAASDPAPGDPPCPRRWSLAVELDAAAIERFGGRRADAVDAAELLLGFAAESLRSASGVEMQIDRFVLFDAPAPAEPVAVGALSADLWSRWSTRADSERPSTVLLISGRPLEDRAFGLSWIGGIGGGPAQRCAVLGVDEPRSLLGRSATLLHALAHVLGADHCGEGCGVMSSGWSETPSPALPSRASAQVAALVQRPDILPTAPLAAPTGLSASDGRRCEGVELSWTPVVGATSYEVLRSADVDDAPSQVVATVAQPPWLDASATPATPLRYRIRALDRCRRSELGDPEVGFAPAPVAAPTQVSASDGVGCAETTVAWEAVPHAAGYEVLRNAVNNPATATALGRVDVPRFVDGAPPPGAVVWYWVRALDACGRPGPLSRGDSGFMGGVPPAPTGVAATDGTACGTVILTWNAVAGATSYSIWRSTTPDLGQATQLAEVPASPFEDTAAPPGVDLYFWVRAASACGKGPLGGPDRGRAAGSVPRIAPIGDSTIACGQAYQGPTPALSNVECAEPVEWSIAAGPPGLLMAVDGSVTWPAPLVGTHTITVSARNDSGVGQEQWALHVQPLAPAAAALPPLAGRCGEPLRAAAPALSNAGCAGAVRWSLENAPPGAAIAADGTIAFTPSAPGQSTLSVVATNDAGSAATPLSIVVAPAAPLLAGATTIVATIIAGTSWSAPPPQLANAPCAGPVRWSLVRAPEGVTIDDRGGLAWAAPTAGSHEIALRAANDSGAADATVALSVIARPAPAVAEIPDASAPCGAPWSGPAPTLLNGDAAGPVAWSLVKGPAGATIDAGGVVSWSAPTLGPHVIVVAAASDAGRDEEQFTLVVAPSEAPTINPVPDAEIDAGAAYELACTVADRPCAGPAQWSVVEAPAGAAIDANGVLRWPAPVAGEHAVRVRAANAFGGTEVAWKLLVRGDGANRVRRRSTRVGPRGEPG